MMERESIMNAIGVSLLLTEPTKEWLGEHPTVWSERNRGEIHPARAESGRILCCAMIGCVYSKPRSPFGSRYIIQRQFVLAWGVGSCTMIT